MSAADARREQLKNERTAAEAAAARNRHIQTFIDGTLRVGDEALRRDLIQSVARIDQDALGRRVYNSSVRISNRFTACAEYLRGRLELRVDTAFEAHGAAGVLMDPDAVHRCLQSLHDVANELQTRFTKEAREEVRKSQLGQTMVEQAVESVHGFVTSELNRAVDLFNTRRARTELEGPRPPSSRAPERGKQPPAGSRGARANPAPDGEKTFAESPPKPTVTPGHRKERRSPNAKPSPGFVFIRDVEAEFGVADSTVAYWAKNPKNRLDRREHSISGLSTVRRSALKALIAKRRKNKG